MIAQVAGVRVRVDERRAPCPRRARRRRRRRARAHRSRCRDQRLGAEGRAGRQTAVDCVDAASATAPRLRPGRRAHVAASRASDVARARHRRRPATASAKSSRRSGSRSRIAACGVAASASASGPSGSRRSSRPVAAKRRSSNAAPRGATASPRRRPRASDAIGDPVDRGRVHGGNYNDRMLAVRYVVAGGARRLARRHGGARRLVAPSTFRVLQAADPAAGRCSPARCSATCCGSFTSSRTPAAPWCSSAFRDEVRRSAAAAFVLRRHRRGDAGIAVYSGCRSRARSTGFAGVPADHVCRHRSARLRFDALHGRRRSDDHQHGPRARVSVLVRARIARVCHVLARDAMATHTITLIPGDGIGPEVTDAVLRILAAAGVSIEWERHDAGVLAFERTGQALPAELHRLDPPQQGRAEGTGDDADRRGLHQRQRRPAQGARPLREPAAGLEPARRAVALQGRRPRHRAREHRGPLRRPRARSRAGRGREPEDHHRARRRRASREFAFEHARAARPQEGHGDPQGEHHEAQRRAVPRERARRSRATIPTSPTTSRSSTRRACTW